MQPGGSRPPFYCIHGADGHVLKFHLLAKHLGSDQPFYGLQARGVNGAAMPRTSIEAMVAAYYDEIRAVQPDGPYYLGGYSLGGLIALELRGKSFGGAGAWDYWRCWTPRIRKANRPSDRCAASGGNFLRPGGECGGTR